LLVALPAKAQITLGKNYPEPQEEPFKAPPLMEGQKICQKKCNSRITFISLIKKLRTLGNFHYKILIKIFPLLEIGNPLLILVPMKNPRRTG